MPLPLMPPASSGSSPRVRGTRTLARRTLDSNPVHPRVCGELRVRLRGLHGGQRFIPACAGNSKGVRVAHCRQPVHPRVCGELGDPPPPSHAAARFIPACAGNSLQDSTIPMLFSGSSPRVRGTHHMEKRTWNALRFIPACAGNSLPPSTITTWATVHPRVCGELALRRRTRRWFLRFIPACAGNSARAVAPALTTTGSSPRVRGTPASRAHGRTR